MVRWEICDYNSFSDHSFNLLNIDLVYKWRFAPGSDLFFIWKNEIFNSADEAENLIYNYRQSFDNLGYSPQSNTLSLKLIYYLDYLSLAGKK